MEVITLETKAYQDLIKEIESIRGYLEEFKKPTPDEWLTTDEVCNRIKISKRTLQTYRDRNLIQFVQIGPKILYSTKQIDEFLNLYLVKGASDE